MPADRGPPGSPPLSLRVKAQVAVARSILVTIWAQVAVQHPGTAQRGHQPQRPVLERLILVLIGLLGPIPLVDLRELTANLALARPDSPAR